MTRVEIVNHGRGSRMRTVAAVVLLATSLIGCGDRAPSARRIAAVIEAGAPGIELTLEEHLSLGRLALGATRALLAVVGDDADEARVILAGLRRVEVATFRVGGDPFAAPVARLAALRSELESKGWSVAVSQRDGGSLSWVMTRDDQDRGLVGMLVVSLEADELEVVSLDGRLDGVLAAAISNDPEHAPELLGIDS